MEIHDARVREHAEAQLTQLRTIPRSEALKVLGDILSELYRLREMYTIERDGCDPCDKFK